MDRRPKLEIVAVAAAPEEAAAIVAALERFMRETAPALAPAPPTPSAWARAALLEAAGHGSHADGVWGSWATPCRRPAQPPAQGV